MKKESALALLTVVLISGCQHEDDKRLNNHHPASKTAINVVAAQVPALAADAAVRNKTQTATIPTESPRLDTVEAKRFMERPCCSTALEVVMTQRATAVPLIVAMLDRLSGETNAPTRRAIIQGALWNPEVCTNIQFNAIIQRGTNDPSESVRLKTSLMVSNALVRLQLIGVQTK